MDTLTSEAVHYVAIGYQRFGGSWCLHFQGEMNGAGIKLKGADCVSQ